MVDVDALAPSHRQGPGVGPRHHDDGNAEIVEAGDVGDAGDAHRRQQRAQAFDRLLRHDDAVCAAPVRLGSRSIQIVFKCRNPSQSPTLRISKTPSSRASHLAEQRFRRHDLGQGPKTHWAPAEG